MPQPVAWLAGRDRPVASIARHLISVIENVYAEQGVGLPSRRYVAVGALSTVDSEQLVVMFGGAYTGLPGNELNTPSRGDTDPRSLTFNVELWRYIPTLTPSGNPPSPEVIAAASEQVMQDAWLLLESAFDADTAAGIIARAGVNEPQGDYHGVSMIVELQVP